MAGPGTFKQTVTPASNTNLVGSPPATANAGTQQGGGAVILPSGAPVKLVDPIVSIIATDITSTGIITVTQATDANANTATLSFATQTARSFFAGPVSGTAAAPTFRTIATTDLVTPDAAGFLASDGAGTLSWMTVTVPAGANPTASVGLSAVNGSAATFLRSDGAPALSQAIVPTWTGIHSFTQTPGANTVSDAVVLQNTAAATSGNQQYTPALHLKGFGTKTTGGVASRAVEWRVYGLPITGSGNPSCQLNFDFSVNAGAFATKMNLSSTGVLTVPSLTVTSNFTAGFLLGSVLAVGGGSAGTGSICNLFGLPNGAGSPPGGLNPGDVWYDTTGGLNILKVI